MDRTQRRSARLKRRSALLAGRLVCLGVVCLVAVGLGVMNAGSAAAQTPPGTFRDCAECPQMVPLPGGRFLMGSTPRQSGVPNQQPQRPVTVPAFAVGLYEVTWREYDACVAAGACAAQDDDGFGRGSRPAINMSWPEAKAYVAWLSERTGRRYRLLSEAEWEYAARAGTTTLYSFGSSDSQLGDYAWHSGNSGQSDLARYYGTHPVGARKPNGFGLYDMHGNVSEWVEDCWAESYNEGQPSDGSAYQGPDGFCFRVTRGGSWADLGDRLESAFRIAVHPEYHHGYIGFRVATTR